MIWVTIYDPHHHLVLAREQKDIRLFVSALYFRPKQDDAVLSYCIRRVRMDMSYVGNTNIQHPQLLHQLVEEGENPPSNRHHPPHHQQHHWPLISYYCLHLPDLLLSVMLSPLSRNYVHTAAITDLQGSHTYLRRRAEYRAIYHLPPDPMETEPGADVSTNNDTSTNNTSPSQQQEHQQQGQPVQREEFIITACEGDHVRVRLKVAENDATGPQDDGL